MFDNVDVETLTVLRFNRAYRGTGLEVVHRPDAKCSALRWQCIRPNNGHIDVIAFSFSAKGLLEAIRARSWRVCHARNGNRQSKAGAVC
jgi:hypothetical protein